MKYKYYYVEDNNKKSNCVIRSFCRLYDDSYESVYNDLISLTKELKCDNYNDIKVFETYMENHNTIKIASNDVKIKDLKLDNGEYIVFCYDKEDYYHMVPIINNTVYDKNDKCLDLYAISIYKKRYN